MCERPHFCCCCCCLFFISLLLPLRAANCNYLGWNQRGWFRYQLLHRYRCLVGRERCARFGCSWLLFSIVIIFNFKSYHCSSPSIILATRIKYYIIGTFACFGWQREMKMERMRALSIFHSTTEQRTEKRRIALILELIMDFLLFISIGTLKRSPIYSFRSVCWSLLGVPSRAHKTFCRMARWENGAMHSQNCLIIQFYLFVCPNQKHCCGFVVIGTYIILVHAEWGYNNNVEMKLARKNL